MVFEYTSNKVEEEVPNVQSSLKFSSLVGDSLFEFEKLRGDTPEEIPIEKESENKKMNVKKKERIRSNNNHVLFKFFFKVDEPPPPRANLNLRSFLLNPVARFLFIIIGLIAWLIG